MANPIPEERTGELTWGGSPMTLLGRVVHVGEKAPDFKLVGKGFKPVTLGDSAETIRLLSVVPSLDTGICDAQTRKFNEIAAGYGEDVTFLTISAEHPFNQRRWCGAAGIKNMEVLSDHMDMNFGDAYGTHIKEMRLDQRAIFIIDADDTIRYIEYLPEIARHPNYEAALAALDEVVSKT
ncbi:MAG: thiol peroxidase [Candidatus Promineifilaceae bacterium]